MCEQCIRTHWPDVLIEPELLKSLGQLQLKELVKRSYCTKTVTEPVKVHVSDTVDSLGV